VIRSRVEAARSANPSDLDSGHFLAEEMPNETAEELIAFFFA
jgi:hypothetical protein